MGPALAPAMVTRLSLDPPAVPMSRRRAVVGLALALSLLPLGVSAAEAVRVALADGQRLIDVGLLGDAVLTEVGGRPPGLVVPGPRTLRLRPTEAGLDVGGWRVDGQAVRLDPRRGGLRLGGREYGGVLEVWRTADGLLAVNELGLEEYVAGTVRAEAPERWPDEALRAIAVVARTYAAYNQVRNAGKVFHLVAGSQDQNFSGRVPEGSPAWDAVRSTAGQVLTWQGRLFPTFYHSDSGGFTEPPRIVFSGDGIPPLPGVRDEFSLESPNYTWVLTVPLATLTDRLRQGGLDVGPVARVTVLERTASLRVARIAVEHGRGTATLRGTDFRRLVGYDALKSTLFVPIVFDGVVRFEGRGWGHGVGLSQFGAKGMADRGYRHPQILGHYYPGAVLAVLP